jgi:hypothetical protein
MGTSTVSYHQQKIGCFYVQKNDRNIEFKVKNDNIQKVLRNYENNRLCASMLGRQYLVMTEYVS